MAIPLLATTLTKHWLKPLKAKERREPLPCRTMYNALPEKRVLWLMIPAGPLVDTVIEQLLAVMQAGDTVIDGGNSHYKDSLRRHDYLKEKGIGFLDCGTSGGISGALNGACTMVGGDADVIEPLHSVFRDIRLKMVISIRALRVVVTLPKWCTTALSMV